MSWMWWIAGILVLLAIGYGGYRLLPVLGGRLSKGERETMERKESVRYAGRKFDNLIPTSMAMGPATTIAVMIDFMKGGPRRQPKETLAAEPVDMARFLNDERPQAIWFGHSTFLLRIEGKTLLVDPMLGRAPSPFPAIGGKRFSEQPPLAPKELPPLDAVLITHDHYDHLDYGTVRQIKDKVGRFFVPYGVRAHLVRWGVAPDKIEEMGWWDSVSWNGLTLACTPARHFSGRRGVDRNATLWCSWAIRGRDTNVFCSGDSGYGPHFKEIGERFGPFDAALVECGQYDPRWEAIHMMPEMTVQAHLDVRAKLLIPIHWGAFTLAVHDWTDPVERAAAAARKLGVTMATPRIGQVLAFGAPEEAAQPWWR